tara:strand:+ start:202 stop:735 length:534 start_codon:yes stop_codon:yes gene_type:complete
MKHCTTCNQQKPHDEFHKRRASKDGLNTRCKVCHNKYTTRYRNEIRPDYWNCRDGYFSERKNWEYIIDYRKADKDITIYLMKVKHMFYVGMTKSHLNVRMSTHKADYKNTRDDKARIKGLHSMWDTMSMEEIEDAILTTIVLETKPGPRHVGYKMEEKWIKDLANRGYKLLNHNHNK